MDSRSISSRPCGYVGSLTGFLEGVIRLISDAISALFPQRSAVRRPAPSHLPRRPIFRAVHFSTSTFISPSRLVLSLRFVLFLHKTSLSRRSLDHDVRILHYDGDCVSRGERALRIAGGHPSPNPSTRMHRRNGRKRDMPHRSNLSSRRSGKLLAHSPRPRRFRHRQVRRLGRQERQTRRQGPHVVCILPELSSL